MCGCICVPTSVCNIKAEQLSLRDPLSMKLLHHLLMKRNGFPEEPCISEVTKQRLAQTQCGGSLPDLSTNAIDCYRHQTTCKEHAVVPAALL